jgi:hypothetical protein
MKDDMMDTAIALRGVTKRYDGFALRDLPGVFVARGGSPLIELKTGAFVMSLPVTPMDVYWGKLLANLAIYLVPFAVVTGGMVALILTSSLPNGLVPWVAVIAVESEAWNVATMLLLMTLIGPFIWWVGTMEGIASHMRGDAVVWSGAALGLLGGQAAVIFVVVILTSWAHARKRSFL